MKNEKEDREEIKFVYQLLNFDFLKTIIKKIAGYIKRMISFEKSD